MMIAVSKAVARIAHRSAIASTHCNSAGICTTKCKSIAAWGLDLALNYKLSVQDHRNKVSSQDACLPNFKRCSWGRSASRGVLTPPVSQTRPSGMAICMGRPQATQETVYARDHDPGCSPISLGAAGQRARGCWAILSLRLAAPA